MDCLIRTLSRLPPKCSHCFKRSYSHEVFNTLLAERVRLASKLHSRLAEDEGFHIVRGVMRVSIQRCCSVLGLSMLLCCGVSMIGSSASAVPITKLHDQLMQSGDAKGPLTRRGRTGSGATLSTTSPTCTALSSGLESVQSSPRTRGRGANVGTGINGGTGTGTRSRPRRGRGIVPPPPTIVAPCLDPSLGNPSVGTGDEPLLDPTDLGSTDVLVDEFSDPDESTYLDLPIDVLTESDSLEFSPVDAFSAPIVPDIPGLVDRQSVPEPGTLATLGGSILALTWMIRRRRRVGSKSLARLP